MKKILISVVIVIMLISTWFFIFKKEKIDTTVLDEVVISELALNKNLPSFGNVEILNYKDSFAKAKLFNSKNDTARIVFLKKNEFGEWEITKEADEEIGYSCKDVEKNGFPNEMLLDCKIDLDDTTTVTEFKKYNSAYSSSENVDETIAVVGKVFFGEDPNCNCAILSDGQNEIEIKFEQQNSPTIYSNYSDGQIVVINIPKPVIENKANTNSDVNNNEQISISNQDNGKKQNEGVLMPNQIVIVPENISQVNNEGNLSDEDDLPVDNNDTSSLSDYDPNPSNTNSSTNQVGGFLDRNFSEIPIKVIGDQGSF